MPENIVSREVAKRVLGCTAVWKTIKRQSAHDIASSLEDFEVDNWSKELIGKIDFTLPINEYDLFMLSTSQLTGSTSKADLEEISTGIKVLGFQKCPLWIGPQLRAVYTDQPDDQMLSLLNSDQKLVGSTNNQILENIFMVRKDEFVLKLAATYPNNGKLYSSDRLWIVCRPCR